MSELQISGRSVGSGHRAYIIAEISANHGQDFNQAAKIVEAAHAAGADAVKLQTYTADTLTLDCASEPFQVGQGTIWAGRTLYDIYREASTPWDWQPKLQRLAHDLGLELFSTPFDPTAVDFLEEMQVPAYKIASLELVDIPLIEKVARTGKPIIMSTGTATLAEIDEAVRAARGAGGGGVALLKCTSAYPASPEDMNLRTISHLAASFGVPAGLSDHTLGVAVPVAAVALGACIIEKHLTLSRELVGPDSSFSLEPHEFKEMVTAIRVAEKAIGEVCYEATSKEQIIRRYHRSLFVVTEMRVGDVFTADNVRSIRPGDGLPPRALPTVLGRRATRDIARGTPLDWALIG